jgi:tripartite-type tricarboxylate transporter receptor subunit TctC
VKALAVSTQQRFPMMPHVATVAESAVPGFDINFFFGIAAPAKVPPGVVARVSEVIKEITDMPDIRARMSMLGMSVDFRDSEQFRDLIAREYQKYGGVVRQAGIEAN